MPPQSNSCNGNPDAAFRCARKLLYFKHFQERQTPSGGVRVSQRPTFVASCKGSVPARLRETRQGERGYRLGLGCHPVRADAHFHQQGHIELGRPLHLPLHQRAERPLLLGGQLEHEFVVHLQ